MRRFTCIVDNGWKIYEIECYPINSFHNHTSDMQFLIELPEKYMHQNIFAHSAFPNEEDALADLIINLRKDVDNKKISKEDFFREVDQIQTVMLEKS